MITSSQRARSQQAVDVHIYVHKTGTPGKREIELDEVSDVLRHVATGAEPRAAEIGSVLNVTDRGDARGVLVEPAYVGLKKAS
jgi:hypothetical protein